MIPPVRAGSTRPAAADGAPAPRLRTGAVLLLACTLVLAFLVLAVSYGLTREYGDATADDHVVALRALRDWGPGVLLVVALAVATAASARRSRGRRGLTLVAATAAVVTVLGVPAGAVVGVHRKLAAFPAVPPCTSGFDGGPAVRVVSAVQAAFEEIEHPGPFSGGGESGIAGCESQLVVRPDVDVTAAYRGALRAAGWRLERDEAGLVGATKDGLRFSARRDRQGSWWVRIEPRDRLR